MGVDRVRRTVPLTQPRPVEYQQAARLAFIVVGGIAAGLILAASVAAAQSFELGGMGAGQDARAYWLAIRDAPYSDDTGTYGAYLYSPAFMQLLGPVLNLPWEQFLAVWTSVLIGALLLLAGPVLFALVLPLAFFEVWGGNIHLLLALAIVAGFRWPAAWAFVILTKVTPGIGVLWFAARREWRSLAVALGVTAAVIAISWLVDPGLWRAWLDMLTRDASNPSPPGSIGVPLGLRLPFAGLLIVYAALTDRRWLVPLGALLAMPVLWWGGLSLLVAMVALERRRAEELVMRLLPSFVPDRRPEPRSVRPLAVEPESQ